MTKTLGHESVKDAKKKVSAREFIKWTEHFSRNRRHPLEYYMARLTAEIVLFRKMFSDSNKASVSIKDFLIGDEYDWESLSKKKMKAKPLIKKRKATVEEADRKAKLVFSAFFGATGMVDATCSTTTPSPSTSP